MYLFYKDLKRILQIVTIVGGIAVVLLLFFVGSFWPLLLVGYIVGYFAIVLFLDRIAIKRYDPIIKKLGNCQTADFIWEHQALLANDQTDTLQRKQVQLNLVAGLWDAGEFQTAWELLQTVDLSKVKNKLYQPLLNALCQSLMVSVHLRGGNPDAAQAALEEIRRILSKQAKESPWTVTVKETCEGLQYNINVKRGELDGAYEYYSTVKNSDKAPAERTHAAWQLHLICETEGKREEAIEHLRFVSEHGGDTYYAKEARRILNDN